jgi:hypothetical protein
MRHPHRATYLAASRTPDEGEKMSRRNTLSLLALAAAAFYALTGAIELAHDQPTVFADPIDYWLEACFVAALAASVAVLVSIGRAGLSGRSGTIGWLVAAAGNAGLLVAAAATLAGGRESLDPLFGLGFLAIVVGYLTLAVVDVRGTLVPRRGGLVLLAGFVATAVLDNLVAGSGGLVLAAAWAALSRLIAIPDTSTSPTPRAARTAGTTS